MKEKEGFTLKRVISAMLVGALLGFMLYETGIVDKTVNAIEQRQAEVCGEDMRNCPTSEPNYLPPKMW